MKMTVEAVFTGAEGCVQCLVASRDVETPSESGVLELEELGFSLPVARYYPEQKLLGVLVSGAQFAVLSQNPEWQRP